MGPLITSTAAVAWVGGSVQCVYESVLGLSVCLSVRALKRLTKIRPYVPLDTKQVISETLFAANIMDSTEETLKGKRIELSTTKSVGPRHALT